MCYSLKFSHSELLLSLAIAIFLFSCKKDTNNDNNISPVAVNNMSLIAKAGPDQVITLPTDSITLDGSASNDSDGRIIGWFWKKIEGPDFYVIDSASSSLTKVKNLVAGRYMFELKVTNNAGLIATDIIIVTVNNYPAAGIDWLKTFGGRRVDIGQYIQSTADGGYIIAGNTNSNDGDITGYHVGTFGCYQTCFGQTVCDYFPDGLVVKLSSTGSVQWHKVLGGSGADNLLSIKSTADGGYIASGLTYSNDGDVIGFHGGNEADAWVVKLSSSGSIQWQKVLGGATGCDFANAVLSTPDGGYLVAGHTDSNDGDVTTFIGERDVWIVKLTSGGAIQWQKSLGGSKSDYAYSFQATTDGGYIVAGYSYSNDGDVTGNHGDADAWIVKLNSSGVIQWQKSFGGLGEEIARSIQPTLDGGYILAGSTKSNDGDVSGNHGDADAWIVKLNSSGVIQWQQTLGGSGEEIARSIQPTADGGYIVTGSAKSNDGDVGGNHGGQDLWIVKLGSNGAFHWQKTLGGASNDFANSIQPTTDGGYIVTGQTYSNNGDVSSNQGAFDVWVIKLKP